MECKRVIYTGFDKLFFPRPQLIFQVVRQKSKHRHQSAGDNFLNSATLSLEFIEANCQVEDGVINYSLIDRLSSLDAGICPAFFIFALPRGNLNYEALMRDEIQMSALKKRPEFKNVRRHFSDLCSNSADDNYLLSRHRLVFSIFFF